MGRVLTEAEVQTIGEAYGISIDSNRCCTTAVAATLNCTTTDPSSPSYNQLICAVKKIYTYYLNGAESINTTANGNFGGDSRKVDSSNNTTFAAIKSVVGYGNVTVTSVSNDYGVHYLVNYTLKGDKKGYVIITQQISGKTLRVSVNGG